MMIKRKHGIVTRGNGGVSKEGGGVLRGGVDIVIEPGASPRTGHILL